MTRVELIGTKMSKLQKDNILIKDHSLKISCKDGILTYSHKYEYEIKLKDGIDDWDNTYNWDQDKGVLVID